MIRKFKGDVLNIDRGIIVHGCNAQGVMGSGIALQIKHRFPGAFTTYVESALILGSISIFCVNNDKYIVNAITQPHFGPDRRYVNYEAITTCMERVCEKFSPLLNLPICFPSIGAGLGGGNWRIIETIIDETVPDDYEKHHYVL